MLKELEKKLDEVSKVFSTFMLSLKLIWDGNQQLISFYILSYYLLLVHFEFYKAESD